MITHYSNMTKLTLSDTWYAFRTNRSFVIRLGKLRITLGHVCRIDWMRRTVK